MYTIYGTTAEAIAVNTQAAEQAGCNMESTREHYHRIQHPTDGRSALLDKQGEVTEEQLRAEGWYQIEE